METTDALRDAIFDKLRSGEWRPGARIPTERKLSEQYRVSRTTVRRVLAGFKEKNLISQTVGSGTFVTESVMQSLQKMSVDVLADTVSPPELVNARLVFEPAIVEMVVYSANAADFASMEMCCDRAERADSLEQFEYWDEMFHEAIAVAAHNALVLNVFRLINQTRSQSEWGLLKKRSVTPERRMEYQQEHRALTAALKQRDLAVARKITLDHLLHVRKNLFGY